MEKLDKEDHVVETFMGSTYKLGRPETIGQLRSLLERIAADLPDDSDLVISEVYVGENKIAYTLRDGIVQ